MAFGVLPLAAVGRQLVIHVEHGFPITNFFGYFTNLSNILAGLVLLLPAASKAPRARFLAILRATAVIDMALVGILFSVLLRNADLGSLLPWVNFVLHYLMPCIAVLDWIVLPPAAVLGRRELMICLIFPIAYVICTLVRGYVTGWYPYPFLNPGLVGAGGVAAYVAGITLAFLFFGWALIEVGRLRRPVR